MDQSYTDSDVSLSPSKILDRLQILRHLQLLQRGKLQKHRLEFQESIGTSSSITEIVSHFSNSTSYNTFSSLLESTNDGGVSPQTRSLSCNVQQKVKDRDLIEGVSALNLSQESEFIISSPISTKSRISAPSATGSSGDNSAACNPQVKSPVKKHIALDEMPILSPKHDFEALVIEKLKNDNAVKQKSLKADPGTNEHQKKKPFLRRGEGIARFGLKKNAPVIQNTKSLPWRRKNLATKINHTPVKAKQSEKTDKVDVQIMVTKNKKPLEVPKIVPPVHKPLTIREKAVQKQPPIREKEVQKQPPVDPQKSNNNDSKQGTNDRDNSEVHSNKPIDKLVEFPTGKHPLKAHKGRTWAAVLTKEQDDFLRQLKQSDYYKNFVSPAKSTISEVSCDENMLRLQQEREKAEQNMFELLENKVGNDSFNMEGSFFSKFLKRNLENSGESTPLVMQRCLANNPELLQIFPGLNNKSNTTKSDGECSSEYTDCSDDCSSDSCCCSCKTVEETPPKSILKSKKKDSHKEDKTKSKETDKAQEIECHDDTVTEDGKANMAEMNAKLVATSEMLKERLHDLEDEIETFKNENANLAKMREEIDLERQKFYEEKNAYEQKFNEEKILYEYQLAEEKEKLTKEKQQYEKYIREIRGRLNKKEKEEVINLKKEISDLKEEIRIKDAKSTSTIARLRNQMKIMEKEKENLQKEVEQLKKENRRIQHSNEVTRRLTNLKYLEQINKKLSNMSKNTQSDIDLGSDVKYRAFEIERQSRSRSRKIEPVKKGAVRPRAKSVPNLKATSHYAKYFSQRDALSHLERKNMTNFELIGAIPDDESDTDQEKTELDVDSNSMDDNSSPEDENNIERIYIEKFQSLSPKSSSNRSSLSNTEKQSTNPDPFFIQKSHSKESVAGNHSPHLRNSKSPVSILCNKAGRKSNSSVKDISNLEESNSERSKSPVSILSRSSGSQKSGTVVNQENYRDKLMTISPEPSTSKTSLSKTSLNPTEIKKPDGSKELRFPNGNVKYISADGKYSKFVYYNGDIKENFYDEGRIKYFYADAKTCHTTHADGLEVLEFPDGQVEKRYKDGSSEIRLPNGSVRYFDPKNKHVKEEWRFPDGTVMTVAADGEQRVVFTNGQVEVHAKDHKRREFPDGTVKLVYNDGTSETRYASGRVRVKDKHGNLIMDSAPG